MGYFQIGPEEQKILDEVAEIGRLNERQEDILYNITLRQDELGRTSTNIMWNKIKDDPTYTEMFKREFLTYELFNNGGEGTHAIASLYVTYKGIRYCIIYGEELSRRRKLNPAGAPWGM